MNLLKKNIKGISFREMFLRRNEAPLKITKKINDMVFMMKREYKNFSLSSADLVKQKEVEEYLRIQQQQKLKRLKFIKENRIIFQIYKKNLPYKTKFKTVKILEHNKLYSKIILNNSNSQKYLPYLSPIKKKEINKKRTITDPNKLPKRKQNDKISIKKAFKRQNKIKSAFCYRTTSTKNNIQLTPNRKNFLFNFRSTLIKQQTYISDDENPFKQGNRNRPLSNINPTKYKYHRVKKKINSAYIDYLTSKNSKICLSSSAKKRIDSSYSNNPSYSNYNPSSNKRINYTNLLHRNLSAFNVNRMNPQKNNNNNDINCAFSFLNKKNNLFEDEKNRSNKGMTLSELSKSTFKLLPKLSDKFNSTMELNHRIFKNFKSLNKEFRVSSKFSKRMAKKIEHNYFGKIEKPTFRNSIKMANKKIKKKKEYDHIVENPKGHIRLKVFSFSKKPKSDLSNIVDYNTLRDRRQNLRKNKFRDFDLGLGFNSKRIMKEKKVRSYLGIAINNLK